MGTRAFAQLDPWQQGVEMGYQALQEKRYEDAEQWFRNALGEVEMLPPEDGRLNQALVGLETLFRAWSPAKGETCFRDLLSRWEKENPDDPRVASVLIALSALLHREPIDAGRYARIVPLYQRAQRIREAAYGEDAPCLVETLERLAWYAAQTGRDEARQDYTRAIELKLTAGERDTELASLYYALAGVHWDAGRHADAAQHWQHALEIYNAVDPESGQTASTLNRLAWACERLGDYPRMAALWERAAAIREKLTPTGWELLQVLGELANARRLLGNLTDAEQTCLRDLAIRRQAHPGTGDPVQVVLADIYLCQGRINEARALYRGIADPFGLRVHVAPAGLRILACLGLGQCALAEDDHETAMPWLIRAQELLENTLGADDDETAIALHLARHENSAAADVCVSLLDADARRYPANHPRIADHLALLAQAYAGMGEGEKAKESIVKALGIWDKTFGPEHPTLIDRLLSAAAIYQICGMKEETVTCLARAGEIAEKTGSIDGLLALARYYRRVGDGTQVRRYCEHALLQAELQYAADDPRITSVRRQCDALQAE